MQIRHVLVFTTLFLGFLNSVQSQTIVRGISNWKSEEIRAYRVADYISEAEIEIGRAKVDSNAIFQFNFVNDQIEKVILRGANYFAWLYIQPKTTYFIELPEPEEFVSSLERNKEVEMLFFRLDTNDVNYEILGFEAWMDESIADIYQLKDIHPEQFIAKVRSFKQETLTVYSEQKSQFFFDYLKYSVGITVDNFNILGGPSKQDKFEFYLSEDSILYKNPKYVEFASLFYEKYIFQLEKETKKKVESALYDAALAPLTDALAEEPFIQTKQRAEFVVLLMCKEAFYQGYLDKYVVFQLLQSMRKESSYAEHRDIANELLSLFQLMQIGMKAPNYILSDKKTFYNYEGKWIYLHVFNPSVERCVSEIAALKKLQLKYGSDFQFITIYPKNNSYTKTEQRNLDAITWDKFSLDMDHEIWKSLQLTSFPMYALFDPNLLLHASPALSPTPNGKYETIEKFFREIKRP
ncbi:MAG: TlpA family protein disulfide reductase [Crocinitomicaceae bacterium]